MSGGVMVLMFYKAFKALCEQGLTVTHVYGPTACSLSDVLMSKYRIHRSRHDL